MGGLLLPEEWRSKVQELGIFTGLNDGVSVEHHKDGATHVLITTTTIAAYIELQEESVPYFRLSINIQ
jgi:hypothetical protein